MPLNHNETTITIFNMSCISWVIIINGMALLLKTVQEIHDISAEAAHENEPRLAVPSSVVTVKATC